MVNLTAEIRPNPDRLTVIIGVLSPFCAHRGRGYRALKGGRAGVNTEFNKGVGRGDLVNCSVLSYYYTIIPLRRVPPSCLFNVVSLCEIQELLVNILMPNCFTIHRNIF